MPGIEGGVLECAGEAESDGPGEGAVFNDGSEVVGGLFDSLAAREEDDAGKLGCDMVFENFGGFAANFIWGGLLFVLFTSEDHVDFKDASFQIDFGFIKGDKEAIENFTGNCGILVDIVIAVVN